MSKKLGSHKSKTTLGQHQLLSSAWAWEGHGKGICRQYQKHPLGRESPGVAPETKKEGKWWGKVMSLAEVPTFLPFPQPEGVNLEWSWGWPGLQVSPASRVQFWAWVRRLTPSSGLPYLTSAESFSSLGHYNGQTVLEGNSTLNYQKIGLKHTSSLHKAFIFKRAPPCPWHYWSVTAVGCYHLFSLHRSFFCSWRQLHPWNSTWQMPPGDGGVLSTPVL